MNELLPSVRTEMVCLAKELPEYEIIRAIFGVGNVTAAQLMAEISDIQNYPCRSALIGFAGSGSEVNQWTSNTTLPQSAARRICGKRCSSS